MKSKPYKKKEWEGIDGKTVKKIKQLRYGKPYNSVKGNQSKII